MDFQENAGSFERWDVSLLIMVISE
jgi:hypothetical protein